MARAIWKAMRSLALALLVAGCGTITTNTIRVPVPVPCEVPDVPQPALPVDTVPASADVFTIDSALWATLEILEAYIGQLRAVAAGCRTAPAPTP